MEAAQHRLALAPALLLVLAGEEALRHPGRAERGHEVVGRERPAGEARLEVPSHRLVDGVAVDDRVVGQQGHAQDVDVAVLERAGLVVVDLAVGEPQQLVLRDRAARPGASGSGGGGVPGEGLERGASCATTGRGDGRSRASTTKRETLRAREAP